MKKPMHSNQDLTLDQILDNIQDLRNQVDKPFSKTLELVFTLIGRCSKCIGTGEEENITKPNNGYKVKISPRGARIYLTPCKSCQGSGKQLDVQCCSCGKSAAIMPEQRHLAYCHECESRLRLKGILS